MADASDDYGAPDPLSAAYHEAGHGVMGFVSGCPLESVHIRPHAENWIGGCAFGKSRVTAEDRAAIAIAGVLAQVKFQAERAAGARLVFDRARGIDDLLTFLKDSPRNAHDPGGCDVFFLRRTSDSGAEESATHRLDGRWYSAADAMAFRAACAGLFIPSKAAFVKILTASMEDFETPELWSRVEKIAEALTDTSPEGEEGRLEIVGPALQEILAPPGDQG